MSILFSRFPNFVSHFETFCNKSGTLKKNVLRRNHSSTKILENLCDRSVLRLAGKETPDFLQGLITNDMKLLEQGSANIYSLFLNIKGRVLYDTIIYKGQDEHVYYVECDTGIIAGLERHLKMYRVRRKVDIDSMEAKMKIWVAFDPKESDEKSETPESNEKKLGSIFPCASSYNKSSKRIENMMIYEDPRLSELGLRVFAESGIDRDEITRNLNFPVSSDPDPLSYREYRYKLGVGEGVADFPPGKPFPLEINCDYLHGVSFHKGCYIGQELTARTYHTGVIRKRLMPLKLESENCSELKYDEKIMDESGKAVGKFIGREGKHGLGLVRIVEGLKARKLSVGNVPVKVTKPSWWPQEVTDSAKISSSES